MVTIAEQAAVDVGRQAGELDALHAQVKSLTLALSGKPNQN